MSEINERLELYKRAAQLLKGGLGAKARGYLAGYFGGDYRRKFDDEQAYLKGLELGKKDKNKD